MDNSKNETVAPDKTGGVSPDNQKPKKFWGKVGAISERITLTTIGGACLGWGLGSLLYHQEFVSFGIAVGGYLTVMIYQDVLHLREIRKMRDTLKGAYEYLTGVENFLKTMFGPDFNLNEIGDIKLGNVVRLDNVSDLSDALEEIAHEITSQMAAEGKTGSVQDDCPCPACVRRRAMGGTVGGKPNVH